MKDGWKAPLGASNDEAAPPLFFFPSKRRQTSLRKSGAGISMLP